MIDIAINMFYGLGLCIISFVAFHFAHTSYKDREWRRNNPDEHDILNRKIKDDFSE